MRDQPRLARAIVCLVEYVGQCVDHFLAFQEHWPEGKQPMGVFLRQPHSRNGPETGSPSLSFCHCVTAVSVSLYRAAHAAAIRIHIHNLIPIPIPIPSHLDPFLRHPLRGKPTWKHGSKRGKRREEREDRVEPEKPDKPEEARLTKEAVPLPSLKKSSLPCLLLQRQLLLPSIRGILPRARENGAREPSSFR